MHNFCFILKSSKTVFYSQSHPSCYFFKAWRWDLRTLILLHSRQSVPYVSKMLISFPVSVDSALEQCLLQSWFSSTGVLPNVVNSVQVRPLCFMTNEQKNVGMLLQILKFTQEKVVLSARFFGLL